MTSPRIEEALKELERLFRDAIRAEQLVDGLTGLPNSPALDQCLATALDKNVDKTKGFWVAMVEIDYFKRVNDEFGYQRADSLLKEIAQQLQNGRAFFPESATAFRAHGDEFFLFGPLATTSSDAITKGLEQIRGSISLASVPVSTKEAGSAPRAAGPMRCTVSIGWTTSAEASGGVRGLYDELERAVSFAKRKGRDRVVRFDKSMSAGAVITVRETCNKCESAYTCDSPRDRRLEDQLYCPNCGDRKDRPPPPKTAPPPADI